MNYDEKKREQRRVPPPALLNLAALAHTDEGWLFQLRQPTESDMVELHVSYALFLKGFACFQVHVAYSEPFSMRDITFRVPDEAMKFLASHFNNFEQMAARWCQPPRHEQRCKKCGSMDDLNQCACHSRYWWCKRCLIEHMLEQVFATGTRRNANANAFAWDDATDAPRFATWHMGRTGPFAWHDIPGQTASSPHANPTQQQQQQQARNIPKRRPLTFTVREALEVLGVSAQDSSEDIKRAYRTLAHKHHPDHGGSNEAMAKLNAAYKTAIAWADGRS